MFSLWIALRYLFSKKTHSAVNVITLISVAGVAVATMAAVCVMSVFNGFADLALSQLSHLDPDLKVYSARGKVIADGDSLAMSLRGVAGVELAMPVVEDQAFAVYGSRQMPVSLKGVPDGYDSMMTSLRDTSIIRAGEYMHSDAVAGYATISAGVAMGLMAHPDYYEYMAVYTPRRKGRVNTANPLSSFRTDSLVVCAVYQINQAEYDADMVIVPIANTRRLLDYTVEASAVEIKVSPGADADGVQERVRQMLGDDYLVKNRVQQQEQSFRMIEIEKWIAFLMLAFILVIASFNIISTLSMLVLEKRGNIATMRSLGAGERAITRVFMLEGWLISAVGGVAGIILGAVLTLAQQFGRFIKLGGDASVMTIDAYPVRLELIDLLLVFAMVVVIGFVTSQITSLFVKRLR